MKLYFKNKKHVAFFAFGATIGFLLFKWLLFGSSPTYSDETLARFKLDKCGFVALDEPLRNTQRQCDHYRRTCLQTFRKIRNPDPGMFFRPPLRQPPSHLLGEFTQYGEMPISKWSYFPEAYPDVTVDSDAITDVLDARSLEYWRAQARANRPLHYGDTNMNLYMKKYAKALANRTLAIIGTQIPWIESIALEVGTGPITTFDYTRKAYNVTAGADVPVAMLWRHTNDYLDESIVLKQIEQYDNVASFSSIEHSGLGRYGDPLDPNGDINAMKQVHCMLKPGGVFIVGLQASEDDSSFIEFNERRMYGSKRLECLFQGWSKLDESKPVVQHKVFVLQKISQC